jgi:hypothetical protein
VQYGEYVVTFIDILGFRGMIGELPAPQIDGALALLHQVTAPPGDSAIQTILPVHVWSFSDCIVRAIPVRRDSPDYRYSRMMVELWSLARAQLLLAATGVNIRGGMACGQLSVGENRVFGPALVDAYELESKVAEYPRIVVSKSFLTAHGCENADASRVVRKYTQGMLQEDLDGQYFLHYLKGPPFPWNEYAAIIRAHRAQIMTDLGRSTNPRVHAKHRWKAGYHDRTIRGVSEDVLATWGNARADLLCNVVDHGPIGEQDE